MNDSKSFYVLLDDEQLLRYQPSTSTWSDLNPGISDDWEDAQEWAVEANGCLYKGYVDSNRRGRAVRLCPDGTTQSFEDTERINGNLNVKSVLGSGGKLFIFAPPGSVSDSRYFDATSETWKTFPIVFNPFAENTNDRLVMHWFEEDRIYLQPRFDDGGYYELIYPD